MTEIDLSAARSFYDADDLRRCHENKCQSVRYGRDGSTNTLEAEAWFEARYPERRALLFGSGMSACSALLDVMMDEGRTLYVPHEHYRKLKCVAVAQKWSGYREYRTLDEIEPEKALIWVESPSNPHLKIADYDRLKELQQGDVRIVGDLTLAALDSYRGPVEFDAEIHSCTKYAGGHNDVMAGVAIVRPEWFEPLWERRSYAGGIADPFSSWLLTRSLETYDIRIQKQLENVQAVLAWLKERVQTYYPETAYHRHGGSVVSFRAGFTDGLTDRAGSLETIEMAPNFGGVRSLIEVCATMSHHGKTPQQLKASGVEPDLVRLSVGIEPVEDIIADLERLLESKQ